jgi:hypothetical protein
MDHIERTLRTATLKASGSTRSPKILSLCGSTRSGDTKKLAKWSFRKGVVLPI